MEAAATNVAAMVPSQNDTDGDAGEDDDTEQCADDIGSATHTAKHPRTVLLSLNALLMQSPMLIMGVPKLVH
jgi:hypothetical protein